MLCERRKNFDDVTAQTFDAFGANVLVASLHDDVTRLPVIGAVEADDHVTFADAAECAADRGRILGRCGRRNQRTSIGGDVPIGSMPIKRRTREKRPSAPMVRRARSSCWVAVLLVVDAADGAVLGDELRDVRAHLEAEIRVLPRFRGKEFEEIFLRKHQDVRKFCLEVSDSREA